MGRTEIEKLLSIKYSDVSEKHKICGFVPIDAAFWIFRCSFLILLLSFFHRIIIPWARGQEFASLDIGFYVVFYGIGFGMTISLFFGLVCKSPLLLLPYIVVMSITKFYFALIVLACVFSHVFNGGQEFICSWFGWQDCMRDTSEARVFFASLFWLIVSYVVIRILTCTLLIYHSLIGVQLLTDRRRRAARTVPDVRVITAVPSAPPQYNNLPPPYPGRKV